jgi:hypothetical protein
VGAGAITSASASASASATASGAGIVESPQIRVVIDGVEGEYTDIPLMMNNRVFLPFRELLTKLGVPNDDRHIIWDPSDSSVTVYTSEGAQKAGQREIRLAIGTPSIRVNGQDKALDAASFLYDVNKRTYVPARAVAEAMDKHVFWEGSTQTVYIRDKANFEATVDALKAESTRGYVYTRYHMDIRGEITAVTTLGMPEVGGQSLTPQSPAQAPQSSAQAPAQTLAQAPLRGDTLSANIKASLDADAASKTLLLSETVTYGGDLEPTVVEIYVEGGRSYTRVASAGGAGGAGGAGTWADVTGKGDFSFGSIAKEAAGIRITDLNMPAEDLATGLAMRPSGRGGYIFAGEIARPKEINELAAGVLAKAPGIGEATQQDIMIKRATLEYETDARHRPLVVSYELRFEISGRLDIGKGISVPYTIDYAAPTHAEYTQKADEGWSVKRPSGIGNN